MSLAGSTMTLAYFLFSSKQDAVGVLQNLFPAFTAAYSLWLDVRPGRKRVRRGTGDDAGDDRIAAGAQAAMPVPPVQSPDIDRR